MRRSPVFVYLCSVAVAVLMAVPMTALAAGGPPSSSKGTGTIDGYLYDGTVGGIVTKEGWVMIWGVLRNNGEPYLTSTYYTPEPAYYELDAVPVGEYTLRAAANMYEPGFVHNVTVQRGKTTHVDFVIYRVGGVDGIVFDAATHIRIEGAYCYLLGAGPDDYCYTDEDGQFTIICLPGEYTLIIEAPGHDQYIYPDPIVITPFGHVGLGFIYIP